MPRAPASNVTPMRPPAMPGTQPTDTDLAMALAMMHAEGKLTPKPKEAK